MEDKFNKLSEDIQSNSEAQQIIKQLNATLDDCREFLEEQNLNFDAALNKAVAIGGMGQAKLLADFFRDRVMFSWEDAVHFSKSISPLLVEEFFPEGQTEVVVPSNIRLIRSGAFSQTSLKKITFNNDDWVELECPIFKKGELPEFDIKDLDNFSYDGDPQEVDAISAQLEEQILAMDVESPEEGVEEPEDINSSKTNQIKSNNSQSNVNSEQDNGSDSDKQEQPKVAPNNRSKDNTDSDELTAEELSQVYNYDSQFESLLR